MHGSQDEVKMSSRGIGSSITSREDSTKCTLI